MTFVVCIAISIYTLHTTLIALFILGCQRIEFTKKLLVQENYSKQFEMYVGKGKFGETTLIPGCYIHSLINVVKKKTGEKDVSTVKRYFF